VRLLVTCVCGFVGATLARTWVEAGAGPTLLGLDSLARPGSETNRLALRRLGVEMTHADLRLPSDREGLPAADFVIDPVGSGKPGASVAADASARDALSAMLATGVDRVTLIDENGAARGTITLAAMRARLTARGDGSAIEPHPLSNT